MAHTRVISRLDDDIRRACGGRDRNVVCARWGSDHRVKVRLIVAVLVRSNFLDEGHRTTVERDASDKVGINGIFDRDVGDKEPVRA